MASGRGKVYIYDGTSYDQIATVDFERGADNLRYDAATEPVYVGCGDDEKTGAIAMIDATTNQRFDEEYKLGGEPESFQLKKSGPNKRAGPKADCGSQSRHQGDHPLALEGGRKQFPHGAR